MVRDADPEAISPVLENLKRQILERLDTIVQRSIPDDLSDANEKRRLASGMIPPGLNTRSDAEDEDINDEDELEKRRTYDGKGVNKRDYVTEYVALETEEE
ncbi:uncharacterized protein N0V89_001177 [Didymosphaeria variabile]|uniref:Uncharacterized protein n=1 Tax=Didymosphaeria variabile TaxID=1932322 RepID=A0A9W8XWP8_9PLEO|nr:uncharacterized protein N0V89_001177 [Didymosphaeria variabile]KAJ4360611.1 hypothetical protein N0V89_001177 [Didymosphaeria variabile]